MTQLLLVVLLILGCRYPYLGVSMLCLYIAYSKPDYLPIVAIIAIYGLYKILCHLAKGINNEHSIKH